jgi:poly(A) polymerase
MLFIGSILLLLIINILLYVFYKKNRDSKLQLRNNELTYTEHKSESVLVSRKINHNATKVISRLIKKGYLAYAVGGCVRDILLNLSPKDFDIVTDATPEQILALFKNSRLIGRRFKLIHVVFGREVIEVATFRACSERKSKKSKSGRLLLDNTYGTIEDDAIRRDFTVNAIYYDHKHNKLLDFSNGIEDLNNNILRIIGDAEARYKEDPVRMIRAVRFSCMLNFKLEHTTETAILPLSHLLEDVPPGRRYNEVVKLMYTGCLTDIFKQLIKFDLFRHLFPVPSKFLEKDHKYKDFVYQATKNTDARILKGKTISPSFMLAVLLWKPVKYLTSRYIADGMDRIPARQQAIKQVISEQIVCTSIPKYFVSAIREIWELQYKLENRKPKQIYFVLSHPRFRAAFDFLGVRDSAGLLENSTYNWWDKIQYLGKSKQESMIKALIKNKHQRKHDKSKKRIN